MNVVAIQGRITRTPELKQTQTGTSVMSFSVAVDRRFSGGEEKKTDFFDCVAWRNTAEFIARNFSKGQMIAITGHLEVRQWTDKDGNNRKNTEIIVDNSDFCGDKKKDDSGEYQSAPQSATPSPTSVPASAFAELDEDDGDLPF